MWPEVDLAWSVVVCGLHPVWWVCGGCVYMRGHVVDGAFETCTWGVVCLVPQVHL